MLLNYFCFSFPPYIHPLNPFFHTPSMLFKFMFLYCIASIYAYNIQYIYVDNVYIHICLKIYVYNVYIYVYVYKYIHKYKLFDHIIIWVYVFRADHLTLESHLLFSSLEMTLPLTALHIAYYFLCIVEVSWDFSYPPWDSINVSLVHIWRVMVVTLFVCRF